MIEPAATETLLHASCVAIDGRAVLIAGPSGIGKSDLALRLIDRGAVLVADDCTLVRPEGAALLARSPATIAGRIEVRGIGIVTMPSIADVPVRLFVALDEAVDRMPAADLIETIGGIGIARIALDGHEASAPIKIALALRGLVDEKAT